jgi:hypothetical protein
MEWRMRRGEFNSLPLRDVAAGGPSRRLWVLIFAVTVPAEALTARLTPLTLGLAVGMAALGLVAARWFWHVGLRHYSGASA